MRSADGRRPTSHLLPQGETIPTWVALVGYLCFLGLAVGVVPLLYPPAR